MADDGRADPPPEGPIDSSPTQKPGRLAAGLRGGTGDDEATLCKKPKIPVILVPGILATKLATSDGTKVWDPDDIGHMLKDHVASGSRHKRKLFELEGVDVIKESTPRAPSPKDPPFRAHGFHEVVTKVYAPFFDKSHAAPGLSKIFEPIFYVVGYDWRRSNKVAAERLIDRCREILKKEKERKDDCLVADKCLVITHSMGALLSRAAFKKSKELEQSCIGVVQVVPPNQGAVVFYTRFFTGTQNEDKDFTIVSGTTPTQFAVTASHIESAFELLPTRGYARVISKSSGSPPTSEAPGEWLKTNSKTNPQTAASLRKDVYDIYGDARLAGSIYGSTETEVRNDIHRNILQAREFHDWLGAYMHPSTSLVIASGLQTDTGAFVGLPPPRSSKFDDRSPDTFSSNSEPAPWLSRGFDVIRDEYGDGSVPLNSARAHKEKCVRVVEFTSLGDIDGGATGSASSTYVREKGHVKHADALMDSKVIGAIWRLLDEHVRRFLQAKSKS